MITSDNIKSLLEAVLDDSDLVIVDIKVRGARGRVGFNVLLDHRSRGITIQECTQWSRKFEDVLDMTDFIPRQYALDVSSPGVGYPLTHDWQYRKNVGRVLEITLKNDETQGLKASEVFSGKLLELDGDTLNFEGGKTVIINEIQKASVKLPW